jgi:hypothetical protein
MDKTIHPENGCSTSEASIYELRVKEMVDASWSEWFDGFTIAYTEGKECLLTGRVLDQAALHGLLAKIRDLRLTLIAINKLKNEAQDDD